MTRFFLVSSLALLIACSDEEASTPAPAAAGAAGRGRAGAAGTGLAGHGGTAGQSASGQGGAAGKGGAGTAGMGGAGMGGAGMGGTGQGGTGQGGAAGMGGQSQGGAGSSQGGAGNGQSGAGMAQGAGTGGLGGAGNDQGGAAGNAGQAGAGGTPSEQFVALYCGARAARACQRFAACACPVPPDITLTDALCVARVSASCEADFAVWKPSIDAGAVVFDAAAVGPCLDALDAWSSPCERPREVPLACLGVLSTAEPIGAPCSYPFCASGAGVCDGPGALCRPLPPKGEPCASTCSEGLVCVAGLCESPVSEGGACQVDETCAPPLRCLSGMCGPARPEGSNCSAVPDACESGLVCQEGTCQKPAVPCASEQDCGHLGHCVQPSKSRCRPPAPVGSSCASTPECLPGLYCDTDARLCAASPAEGAPCAQGAYCAAGLACHALDQVCVPIPLAGEPCAVGAESPFVCAAGLACVDNLCAAPPTAGQPCAGGNVCAAGLGCDFQANGSFCVAPRPEKGPCQNDQVCQAGLHCSFASGGCAQDLPAGAACQEGNECGPAGTCFPDEVGTFRCAPRPAEGETCLFDCLPGLACHAELLPRVCTADACSAVFP
jgi:hypothetical protein